MDAVAGILGGLFFLAGIYALVISLAPRERSPETTHPLRIAVIVGCILTGVALMVVSWNLRTNTLQPAAGAFPPPPTPSGGEARAGDISVGVAIALVFATTAGFGIAYWLAFRVIPNLLKGRALRR